MKYSLKGKPFRMTWVDDLDYLEGRDIIEVKFYSDGEYLYAVPKRTFIQKLKQLFRKWFKKEVKEN